MDIGVRELINWNQEKHAGILSDRDILNEMYLNNIFIYPFQKENLTPLGYNLTASTFILSTKTGIPVRIYNQDGETFAWVAPHDTVLVSTREYLYGSRNIMGTFHSKVKVVSEGFGHISTTFDPNWKGPLLIAVSNPSSSKKKFLIARHQKNMTFVTLVFHYLCTPTTRQHDNPEFRMDILDEYVARPRGFFYRHLLGKSLIEYEKIIEQIHKSMDLKNVEKEVLLVGIKELLEEIILQCRMKVLFATEGEEQRNQLLVGLEKLSNDPKISYELSKDLLQDLEFIKEEMIEGIEIQDSAEKDEHQENLCVFAQVCLKRCDWEDIGRYWEKQRGKIEEYVSEFSTRPTRLRAFVGHRKWKIVLAILELVLFVIIGIFVRRGIGGPDITMGAVILSILIATATSLLTAIILENS